MKKSTICLMLIFMLGCGAAGQQMESDNMKLESSAFKNGQKIPTKYTCDGEDLSPELNIKDVPKNAKSLVLVMDDPDAIKPAGKVWDHWIVFNIPQKTNKVNEGKEPDGTGGKNSWGKTGYGGPCPPDREHRYFFKLYALDAQLDLPEGSTKQEIEKAMQGHIIEKAELIGKYERG